MDKEKQQIRKETTNIQAPIFSIDELCLQYIFVLLPVSDLVTCRQVSKQWNKMTNSENMWLQKYMTSAGICPDKIPKKATGYFRQMYFDRFGRNDLLMLLLQNYNNSQESKYLEKIYEVAISTQQSNFPFTFEDEKSCYDIVGGIDCPQLLFVKKSIKQFVKHTDVTYTHNMTAIITLYSHISVRRALILIEQRTFTTYVPATTANVGLLAFYDDLDSPEYLSSNIGSILLSYFYYFLLYIFYFCIFYFCILYFVFCILYFAFCFLFFVFLFFVLFFFLLSDKYAVVDTLCLEPYEEACQKFLSFMELSITPLELIQSLAVVAKNIDYKCIYKCYFSESPDQAITEDPFQILVFKKDEKFRGVRQSNDKKLNFYRNLAARANGEIQKRNAILMAKKKKFNPSIIFMLEKTIFYSHKQRCGRQISNLNGDENKELTLIYSTETKFELVLPSQSSLKCYTRLNFNDASRHCESDCNLLVDDELLVSFDKDSKFSINLQVLDDVTSRLQVFFGEISNTDVLTYILVAGNVLLDSHEKGNPKKKIWNFSSLEDYKNIELKFTHKHQVQLYQKLCDEAGRLETNIKKM